MENMLGSALTAVVGPMKDFYEKLGGADGERWLEAFKRFLRKEEPWPALANAARLLGYVTSVTVNGAKRFKVKKNFIGDTSPDAEVKIAYLGGDFKSHFLGKAEQDIKGCTLNVNQLKTASLDAPILAELGDRAETTLAYLYELLERQPGGESDVLLTNGYANIFYVRATNGVLWAVHARWYDDGWRVNASSVEYPCRWNAGNQVFSR